MTLLEAFILLVIFRLLYQQRELRRRLKALQREIEQLKCSENADSQPGSVS